MKQIIIVGMVCLTVLGVVSLLSDLYAAGPGMVITGGGPCYLCEEGVVWYKNGKTNGIWMTENELKARANGTNYTINWTAD